MQGDAVREVARADVTEAASKLRGAARVFLVGTGTSRHAADLGARLLGETRIDAHSASASHFARWGVPYRRGDALVVISHTGETAYARRVRQDALESAIPVVSITGQGASWPEAVVTPTRERSETYTVSYVSALAVLAMLAHHLGAPGTGPEALYSVASRVDSILAKPEIGHIQLSSRAMALVGVGPWHITACEAALKLREAAHLICEGFDPERLLHGAAVPYGAGDVLLALQPSSDPDGLLGRIVKAAASEGISVATLAESELPASPVLAQIPMTVRLQLLAAEFAERRQTDPDVAITGSWRDMNLWEAGAPS